MNHGHEPIRMCVICRRRAPKQELLRHTFHNGEVQPDVDQILPGRGWYVCLEKTCLEKFLHFHPAKRKGKKVQA